MLLSLITLVTALGAPAAQAAVNIQPRTGEGVCLQRLYTDEHMRSNPRQFLHTLTIWVQRGQQADEGGDSYDYKRARVVGVRGSERFGNEAGCEFLRNGTVNCAIECDGGSFNLVPGKDSANFRVTKDYYFPLYRQGADPENSAPEDTISLEDKDRDNNNYKLYPVDNAYCERAWTEYQGVPAFGC